MTTARPDPAYRRYMRRMIPLSLAYVLSVAAASWIVPDDVRVGTAAIAVALVPGLAVLGWIWAMGRLLVELSDEYLRLLEIRKFLIATGVTLAGASIWGFVELYSDVPRLPVFFVFPIWCLGLLVGQVVNLRSFGDPGCR